MLDAAPLVQAPSPKPFIDVAAGMIIRPDGSLLLAERPADKPWSGWWELPGGKIEAGESVLQALARELKEELDIDVTESTPWITYTHEYEVNIVRLSFCRVTGWTGEPTGIEGQRLAWVDPHKTLPVGPLLPATEPPMRWLRLPDQYLLTSIGSQAGLAPFLEKLSLALHAGVRLVQFREPLWAADPAEADNVYNAFLQVVQRCHEFNARCLLNSCHPQSWRSQGDGVHFRADDAQVAAAQAATLAAPTSDNVASSPDAVTNNTPAPRRSLVGISAHTASDLAAAATLNADFVVLGHVLATPSHPGKAGMGWEQFAALAQQAGRPVFAIGGQSPQTVVTARRHGAHGIAGIRQLVGARD